MAKYLCKLEQKCAFQTKDKHCSASDRTKNVCKFIEKEAERK
jgi:hypothetical protein